MANSRGTTPSQQEQLVFGKYKSLDEAAQGYNHLVQEVTNRGAQNAALEAQLKTATTANQQYQELLDKMMSGGQQSAASSIPDFKDPDGDVTPETLQRHLDARFGQVSQTVQNIPKMVEESTKKALEQLLAPMQTANQAGMQFFAKPDLDPRFDRSRMESFLSKNPEINKTFQMFSSNAETAGQAYDYAYRLWKAEQGSSSGVNQEEKRSASALPEKPGEPMALPGERVRNEGLMEMGLRASRAYEPHQRVNFMKEFLKNTKLEKSINQMKAYGEAMGIDLSDDEPGKSGNS